MQPEAVVDCFFQELWNQRKLALSDTLIAAECVTHQLRSADGPTPSQTRGPAAMKEHVACWLAAFPDLTWTVEARLASGARVVSFVVMRGTQQGTWMGMPPTGRFIVMRCVTMHDVRQGQIVEDWVLPESYGLFQQLGLIEPREVVLTRAARNMAPPPGGAGVGR